MKIALAGNPNSGKTTMYNALTGSNEKVGNWAGVTVERKTRKLKKLYNPTNNEIMIVDLPGAYSMSPFTVEESITSSYIKEDNPDVIINIVDATNLSRSLFFTTQLLELSIPVIVALNKVDINEKKHTEVDIEKLSKALNCPIYETVSTSSKGLKELIAHSIDLIGTSQIAPFNQTITDSHDLETVRKLDAMRFDFINEIVSNVEKREVYTNNFSKQDKIDNLITNKWIGIPLFAIIMFLVFWLSQVGPGNWIAVLLTDLLEIGKDYVATLLSNESGDLSIWSSMLVDGIIGGVIAVVGFLPLVMVMYFLIALLEDCGYMARVSVLLDPMFKRVGLSGKSVIPFIIGIGCSVPGVMGARTIRDERERRATVMLTPFMPCGAKLPVIALFASVFFGKSPWVGPIMYFVGIILIFLSALLINAITGNRYKKTYFIMELPEYKLPNFGEAAMSMLSRGWAYIVKAGTIILLCNFIVHIMQTFNWSFEIVEANESILHDVATPFAYLIAPFVGVVAWQLAAAVITGFIAKENVVGTLAICYGITNFINVDELTLSNGALEVQAVFAITKIAALAYLMFNLFSPPCFATIGAMNAELKSKKWLFAGIMLQLAVGFTISFLVFFFGSLITNTGFGSDWMVIFGWIVVAVITLIVTLLIIRNNKRYRKSV